MERGHATWLLYGAFSCMAFLLNGLGAVLAPLRRELGVSRGDVALYPSLFAVGLLAVGLTGGPLLGRIGRLAALRSSVVGIVLGAVLLAVPGRISTLLGAVLLGLGAALMIQLVPALLAGLHPRAPTAAVGEANGLASAASVLAPLAVAGALSADLGWRPGYLAAPLLGLAVTAPLLWRAPLPGAPQPAGPAAGKAAAPLLGRWLDLVLAVGVEFCLIFWAASALADWQHATPAQAPAVASLFLVGMATGRSLAAPVTRRLASPRSLVLTCAAVAAAGVALFWAAPALALAGAGLAVAGLGVSLLYPATVTRVVAAWPHAPDRAAARATLGSGLAIGVAPLVLGRLSDAVGLRAAFLVVPALLLALASRRLIADVATISN